MNLQISSFLQKRIKRTKRAKGAKPVLRIFDGITGIDRIDWGKPLMTRLQRCAQHCGQVDPDTFPACFRFCSGASLLDFSRGMIQFCQNTRE
ncbi:MAG: hypothetical protein JJU05_00700 [Verrucomicrobia bacterium]|nr:hypothetical protein [Verrucomicrobiota bacterium]MCH8526346.1 hypothetical protein [Kiritimatiellia bacterium]